ncbi:MAG: hypothetical protein Q8M07_08175 [Prosthecobacter sp.]|nr:hypothetical protein [Prosthecobacter sp.]
MQLTHLILAAAFLASFAFAKVERIWMTHQSLDNSRSSSRGKRRVRGTRWSSLARRHSSVKLETMMIEELIPHMDRSYRTLAKGEGRIIEGFSMGDYGAARLGFKHP